MVDAYNKKQLGQRSEIQACEFLEKHGLKLIEPNFRSHFGEIDLIMEDQDTIVFVEVRTRNRADYGSALDSVNKSKQRKVLKTAIVYLQNKEWLEKKFSRFDVIGIDNLTPEKPFEWIKNAFYGDYF